MMKHVPAWKSALLPTILLALVLLLVLPLLNARGMISDYALNLFGKYLALAILALGMNLIWGYTGILSLGQAIFFGLGAYAMGMYLMLESSGKGVYGEAIPDFMVWNRVTTLPLYWVPFKSFPIAVVASILVPALAAAFIGFLTFRRRVGGTYFAILTQAMAFAIWLMFNRNELNLGGTNGLTDFKTIIGFSLSHPAVLRLLYGVTALCLVICFFFCRWLVASKMGLVLTAIRDQEPRLRFLGYPIAQYKIFIFSLAAALAGLAGALYVPQVGIITPNQIGYHRRHRYQRCTQLFNCEFSRMVAYYSRWIVRRGCATTPQGSCGFAASMCNRHSTSALTTQPLISFVTCNGNYRTARRHPKRRQAWINTAPLCTWRALRLALMAFRPYEGLIFMLIMVNYVP